MRLYALATLALLLLATAANAQARIQRGETR